MAFARTWVSGYYNPSRLVTELEHKPAPYWGVYSQLIRCALDALLLYLPLALIGHQPSTPSYLTFIPTERYYTYSIFLQPIFLITQWLFLAAAMHTILRLLGKHSDMDQILNLTGMAGLVIGAALVPWDWIYIALGGRSDIALGISHLLIDLWGIAIVVLGLKRLLGVPVWLGIGLNGIWLALGLPMAMVFVRAPV
jgi:hypothetical protein